jgi:hypothetical protein
MHYNLGPPDPYQAAREARHHGLALSRSPSRIAQLLIRTHPLPRGRWAQFAVVLQRDPSSGNRAAILAPDPGDADEWTVS